MEADVAREEWQPVPADGEGICALCNGEGAVGSGFGMSFVDMDDAMECPRCEGAGVTATGRETNGS